ncbi:hypothetical protein QJS66_22915 [Kocuria rhizophila]|nr:hypothetical protein QJS66_22915 [Kocuria rhizophila]
MYDQAEVVGEVLENLRGRTFRTWCALTTATTDNFRQICRDAGAVVIQRPLTWGRVQRCRRVSVRAAGPEMDCVVTGRLGRVAPRGDAYEHGSAHPQRRGRGGPGSRFLDDRARLTAQAPGAAHRRFGLHSPVASTCPTPSTGCARSTATPWPAPPAARTAWRSASEIVNRFAELKPGAVERPWRSSTPTTGARARGSPC